MAQEVAPPQTSPANEEMQSTFGKKLSLTDLTGSTMEGGGVLSRRQTISFATMGSCRMPFVDRAAMMQMMAIVRFSTQAFLSQAAMMRLPWQSSLA